jgi:hypothetical protein
LAGGARDHHIAATDNRWGSGLIEDHLTHSKQHGHHANPKAETTREHGASDGMRQKRPQRKSKNHLCPLPFAL